jgi:hypothetical protein
MVPTPEQIAGFLARIHLFRGVDSEKLAAAAKLLEVVELPPDTVIYEQGDESAEFYFLFSGRVKMTRVESRSHIERMLGFLDEADFFGVETYEEDRPRKVTVQAISDITLLKLDIPRARQLVEIIPDFPRRFNLALHTYNLMLKTSFSWVNPEDHIYYVSRMHPLFLWMRLLPWGLIGVLILGLMAGLLPTQNTTFYIFMIGLGFIILVGGLVWQYVDWANDYYVITGRRVAFQEKVVLLYDSRHESPIEQVQSISVDTTQIGRIFKYGDVVIRTFTGVIVFRYVPQPQDIVGLLEEMQKRGQSGLRKAELRQIEETLQQRISMTPAKPAAPALAVLHTNANITRFQRFMADLFHLRYENGDTIQYRTHWWILVQRIWFQSLLLLFVIGLQIWMLVSAFTGKMPDFPLAISFMGLCAVALAVFLWWLYFFLDWHNDIYLVTSEQVLDINRKPLGKEEKRVAQIKNILSVEYQRLGIIGLLMNYGTVYIRIGETTFTFDNVSNPSEVQRDLSERISQRALKEREAQNEADRQRMADWITTYHRLTHR